MKLKAKGRAKSLRFNFFVVEGLIVAVGRFCTSPVILSRKMQLTFILKLVLQNIISSYRPFRREKSS